MYSINGRKKDSKEKASRPSSFESKLVCVECGYEEQRSAVFGEQAECSKCKSKNVRFDYV